MGIQKNNIRMPLKAIRLAVLTSAVCSIITLSHASEVHLSPKHSPTQPAELHLSHDLKEVLNQEMNAIQKGMMAIIPAIAAGNWQSIAELAQKIKDSFILKQKLTEDQMKELHHSLPTGFIAIDQSFHVTAGKLAHAAHQGDGELVNFYFYKLHSQCMNCHAKYASDRFSNLKSNQQAATDQH
jgi:cytochrome c556